MGWFLIALFVCFFVFPAFLLPLIGLLGIFLIFYLPLKFTFNSLQTLLTAPKQFFLIATNPVLRKNHALEHATINVLQRHYGSNFPISGYSQEDGFFIRSNLPAWEIEDAAREALFRLQNNEKDLAIHSKCGTTLLVGNLTAAVIFLALMFMTRVISIWYIILAILLANLAGAPLGIFLQRHLTTSPFVNDMVIQNVEYRAPDNVPNELWMFVRTSELKTI